MWAAEEEAAQRHVMVTEAGISFQNGFPETPRPRGLGFFTTVTLGCNVMEPFFVLFFKEKLLPIPSLQPAVQFGGTKTLCLRLRLSGSIAGSKINLLETTRGVPLFGMFFWAWGLLGARPSLLPLDSAAVGGLV